MAVTECLRVVIEKQREGAALPCVVIFTDCRALMQALGGSGNEGVGEAVLLADYLLKTEGVQTDPVDSFPRWGPRQRDSRRTGKRGKVNATATETTNSVRRWVGLATRHRQALGCHSVI
ncbi:hypothetical protein PoB_002245500 [Plakobranchus ocellatus]|uniref:RNase H type-1 domain-containing protein n=1 Tax=Plakobranchus ocellatus TaxID=259542 RepID=A0AAV3ZN13_9GAST|nr:hypothetical protein PoB_002245500 [Plakobranchus ocellatus]